jgi:GT2 family glycosyltransferase
MRVIQMTNTDESSISRSAPLGVLNADLDLSIVIVTWNSKDYLIECLESLQNAVEDLSAEVIVVDNASSDGTSVTVRDRFPAVRLVESGANLGFARGCNAGMKLACGRYICLINPDVNVLPGCLPKMFEFMQKNPNIGLLGPAMLDRDGRVQRSGMRFPSIWNALLRSLAADSLFRVLRMPGTWLMSDFGFDQLRDMEVLNGWFWMARREAVQQVGPLDEAFFMYAEDMDWCKRFWSAGWRVVFYPDAKSVHYGGGSSANDPLRFSLEQGRANLQYWRKHHGKASSVTYLAAVLLGHALRAGGWALVSLVRLGRRETAVFQIKRNLACMRHINWLWEAKR